jgi:glycosyltransferase involved in cell wall biosynthesis
MFKNTVDDILFTFVIPTYNREEFIINTLQSIEKQNYKNYEAIIVDDGGSDNTETVVNNFNNPRFSYFKKINEERGSARNYGLSKAKGFYINFVDSDDTLYPNHLEEAHVMIKKYLKPEIFHLAYDIKDNNEKLIREVTNFTNPINDHLIDGNHLSCNGVFIRRDIAQLHPFNENRILAASEDYELWLRLASLFPIWCNNIITSTVINHEARSVFTINKENFLARVNIFIKLVRSNEIFINKYGHKWNKFYASTLIYASLHLAMAGYKSESVAYLKKALVKYPLMLLDRRFLGVIKNLIK